MSNKSIKCVCKYQWRNCRNRDNNIVHDSWQLVGQMDRDHSRMLPLSCLNIALQASWNLSLPAEDTAEQSHQHAAWTPFGSCVCHQHLPHMHPPRLYKLLLPRLYCKYLHCLHSLCLHGLLRHLTLPKKIQEDFSVVMYDCKVLPDELKQTVRHKWKDIETAETLQTAEVRTITFNIISHYSD